MNLMAQSNRHTRLVVHLPTNPPNCCRKTPAIPYSDALLLPNLTVGGCIGASLSSLDDATPPLPTTFMAALV